MFLLASCSPLTSPTSWTPWFDGVSGSSASDVYAVGSQSVLHYDGRRWIALPGTAGGFLNNVWTTSKGNVYAAWSSGDGGLTGQVLRFDGHHWGTAASAPAALQAVWGSSESDVYAVGRQGTILHYDGSSWSDMSTGRYEWLGSVWGSSSHDVFVAASGDSILTSME